MPENFAKNTDFWPQARNPSIPTIQWRTDLQNCNHLPFRADCKANHGNISWIGLKNVRLFSPQCILESSVDCCWHMQRQRVDQPLSWTTLVTMSHNCTGRGEQKREVSPAGSESIQKPCIRHRLQTTLQPQTKSEISSRCEHRLWKRKPYKAFLVL